MPPTDRPTSRLSKALYLLFFCPKSTAGTQLIRPRASAGYSLLDSPHKLFASTPLPAWMHGQKKSASFRSTVTKVSALRARYSLHYDTHSTNTCADCVPWPLKRLSSISSAQLHLQLLRAVRDAKCHSLMQALPAQRAHRREPPVRSLRITVRPR